MQAHPDTRLFKKTNNNKSNSWNKHISTQRPRNHSLPHISLSADRLTKCKNKKVYAHHSNFIALPIALNLTVQKCFEQSETERWA